MLWLTPLISWYLVCSMVISFYAVVFFVAHAPRKDASARSVFLSGRTIHSPQRSARICSVLSLLFILSACSEQKSQKQTPEIGEIIIEQKASIQFRDITQESNVQSTYQNGREAGVFSILESLGGGTGLIDFDVDGQLDIFFTGGGGFEGENIFGLPALLYRNLNGFTFTEVSELSAITHPETYTQGCSMGDYDCDGFPDILVTGYAGLQLFHNLGDGTFEEVHLSAQLLDEKWSSSAAWGDLNGDGLPDLYVAHYVDWSFENNPVCPSPWPEHERDVCPPRSFSPLADIVYYNDGNGSFTDATEQAQLRKDGKGLGVILVDLNHDTHLDIYVANDMVDNFHYENDGKGVFTENAWISGTATDFEGKPNGSMGLAACDYNADLQPDIWVTNFEQETFALYNNDQLGSFVHASREAGITSLGSLYVGFGTAMGDFDCDGDEDAVISNGHVVYYPTVSTLRQLPLLLENTGKGHFLRRQFKTGYFSEQHLGRGLAVGDLNNDGRLDCVMGHSNEPASLLSNTSTRKGHWIQLKLIGRKSSRDAVGARVILDTPSGKQLRHIAGGGSFQSQNDTRVHFGIPGSDHKVTGITIYWPSGKIQSVQDVPLNELSVIVEE